MQGSAGVWRSPPGAGAAPSRRRHGSRPTRRPTQAAPVSHQPHGSIDHALLEGQAAEGGKVGWRQLPAQHIQVAPAASGRQGSGDSWVRGRLQGHQPAVQSCVAAACRRACATGSSPAQPSRSLDTGGRGALGDHARPVLQRPPDQHLPRVAAQPCRHRLQPGAGRRGGPSWLAAQAAAQACCFQRAAAALLLELRPPPRLVPCTAPLAPCTATHCWRLALHRTAPHLHRLVLQQHQRLLAGEDGGRVWGAQRGVGGDVDAVRGAKGQQRRVAVVRVHLHLRMREEKGRQGGEPGGARAAGVGGLVPSRRRGPRCSRLRQLPTASGLQCSPGTQRAGSARSS